LGKCHLGTIFIDITDDDICAPQVLLSFLNKQTDKHYYGEPDNQVRCRQKRPFFKLEEQKQTRGRVGQNLSVISDSYYSFSAKMIPNLLLILKKQNQI